MVDIKRVNRFGNIGVIDHGWLQVEVDNR